MKLESTIRVRADFLYLAPLLNVVLLLMVFFLLNSNFVVRSGVRVDLPVSGSSLKLYDHAHVITITGDPVPRILLNNKEIPVGDLATRLAALKKETRYVEINCDSNASHGLWQRVANQAAAAGFDVATGTRAEGE